MYLMIDNYDSFVYNLARYFEELGEQVELIRNDQITAGMAERLLLTGAYDGLIISPGPKSPKDSGNCCEILRRLAGRIPILGVCLGHQIIGHAFGAEICKGARPMHGKVTPILTNGSGLFEGLPQSFDVTRYHSLIVKASSLPSCLRVDARSEDGVVMAMHHRDLPIFGVQFHPEAVLTEFGHELLANFVKICKDWWISYENDCPKAAGI
ncbi:MAG: aminodeoxychorismate/anthranilate synthase component II [Eubacteriales bacterium]|nr:aminodeoxychorismate/anthranilate synthase component II [Eubacteriales bacterium]